MPPKSTKNQNLKSDKVQTRKIKALENYQVQTRKTKALESASKIKGSHVENNEQTCISNTSIKMNFNSISVLLNKNDNDASTARPKSAKNNNTTARPKPVKNNKTTAHPKPVKNNNTTARPKPVKNNNTTARPKPVKNNKTTARPKTFKKNNTTARPKTVKKNNTTARPKTVKKNNTTAPKKSLEQNKETKESEVQTLDEDVDIKKSRPATHAQYNNKRKRNTAESVKEPNPVKKIPKTDCKQTQVTPSIIEEEYCRLLSTSKPSSPITIKENVTKNKPAIINQTARMHTSEFYSRHAKNLNTYQQGEKEYLNPTTSDEQQTSAENSLIVISSDSENDEQNECLRYCNCWD